jgi:hypothetical protein
MSQNRMTICPSSDRGFDLSLKFKWVEMTERECDRRIWQAIWQPPIVGLDVRITFPLNSDIEAIRQKILVTSQRFAILPNIPVTFGDFAHRFKPMLENQIFNSESMMQIPSPS